MFAQNLDELTELDRLLTVLRFQKILWRIFNLFAMLESWSCTGAAP